MTSFTYVGTCKQGPLDGKTLSHYTDQYVVFSQDGTILGKYIWNNANRKEVDSPNPYYVWDPYYVWEWYD